MVKLTRVLAVLAAAFTLGGCAASALHRSGEDAPSFVSLVTDNGFRYVHNWEDIPCFTVDLSGSEWRLEDSAANRVTWRRGDEMMSIYFTDNRTAGFAVAGMGEEEILRAFLGYEIDYIRPKFEFEIARQPKFSKERDGLWMAWGWEGRGGKLTGLTTVKPENQRHVIISYWIDPWVMSFDWASSDPAFEKTPTLEMIELIESLEWHPECFDTLEPGSTWNGKG